MVRRMRSDLESAGKHFKSALGRNDMKGRVESIGIMEAKGEFQEALDGYVSIFPEIREEHDLGKKVLDKMLSVSALVGN